MNKRKEIERLNGDIHMLQLLIKAYQRENDSLKKELNSLNAALDAEHADKIKWKALAHKIDKLRVKEIKDGRRTESGCGTGSAGNP